ncbi:hypothetical protein Ancab_037607 [Ancistrocladus abbreviatus]
MENRGAKVVAYLMVVALLAMTSCLKLAYATDPNQLQDFCVGNNDPNATGDFFFSSHDKLGNTNKKNGGNRLFSKLLNEGDVFVFPQGLIHFQMNVGKTNAIAIAALSSQNPGVVTIANVVFGSNPPISADVLTKAFQLDKATIKYLQSKF